MHHCLTGTSTGILSQTAFSGFNAFIKEKISLFDPFSSSTDPIEGKCLFLLATVHSFSTHSFIVPFTETPQRAT